MQVQRLSTNPIITPQSDPSLGTNINGPSLIRVPDWVPSPLGRYYLYFAHHQGNYIRLAFADQLSGPWQVYQPGTLQLEQTPCSGHIASPDVHLDPVNRRFIMYYHGPVGGLSNLGDAAGWGVGQRSFVATSEDGLHFHSETEILGPSYFRVFAWREWVVALSMPGIFLRSTDGFTEFTQGPVLFDANMRHAAIWQRNQTLYVFYSDVGDAPEHIKMSRIQLTPDWLQWRATAPERILWPEQSYEGVAYPITPSERGAIHTEVHQLRDPFVFVDQQQGGEQIYLLYSVAGENGLAIAKLEGLNGQDG